ncbi:DNA-directed RNA polymerase subunit beta' [Anaerotalea alkaliphila]|uniref:DNA-directed RNA polymerase subunit beta' n=1 Tax=Anaerotalea alkaliphila TaxID=2662126 RepID=A0A7X5KML3_9FIRM|nr:DNA-directed RNA polymerase subunit beta' [Anaerotalea alkaliphila]NDL68101.1 DNA-directed RNA polymerase subunit beta' [Anaerotalea alkaliphila]
MSNEVVEQAVNFDAIKIGLASPERILEWSKGEVKKPETINYRTLKPEREGLFCEKIFGPSKDWECHCGKYKKIRYKGVVCDRCGVEVTKSKVRRERMGHIKLAAPVSHIWYFKGIPSRMGLILDMSPRTLEKVLYFASYIVLDAGDTGLQYKQVLTEREYRDAEEKYGNKFEAAMGAEAVKRLLEDIDLEKESVELKKGLKDSSGQKKARIIKRLEVVEAFRQSGNRPEWMIMTMVPVIPPDLRPMVQLDGGRFATSDLNDLYRRVINRNNRLERLLELGAPEIIVRNEKRMLQEAVDALIDNGRRGRPVTGPGNRPLKSLSDMLKGKQGRFRQNLLGKRVDYSGRSVIVVGPELKIYQCGLPKEMAIELFKPFVMKRLVEDGLAHNIKSAKKMVERMEAGVWDVLEEVICEHPVMLNRAPTLHRLGIQAFEPVLVEGKAIRLHPLVCTAYNADFDGDQMAVHVPLSVEAQAECRFLLLSPNNLLKPSDGGPVTVPSQDMVLGTYYLTLQKEGEKGEGTVFKDVNEAILAYENGAVSLHAKIKLYREVEVEGAQYKGLVETTVGRIIFNEAIPQNLGFVDRTVPGNELLQEIEFHVGKKQMIQILDRCIDAQGSTRTAEVLDQIKTLGFRFSTKGAITVSISDMEVPEGKKEILDAAEITVEKIMKQYKRGMMTDDERYKNVVETWKEADDKITKLLLANLGRYNNIFMMADSGARGSEKQIKQLAGMRGLMADTSGRTIELPIKSNFREGLDVLEYFISAHGARKGLADTALRTADSGYLTRRLVDVSQDLIIREVDCCGDDPNKVGMVVKAFKDGNEVIESLEERITGRWSVDDITDEETGKLLVEADTMITPNKARKVIKAGIQKVHIRTALTCKSDIGVCAKCYGADMSTKLPVQIGESVGIIAAQSIGEPGTQLTMRTFHTGGIATSDDITQGLPRIEELFEGRKPKGLAIIAEFGGKVELVETKKKRELVITSPETGEVKSYLIPYGSRIKAFTGDTVVAGDELTEGSVNPHDILKIKGRDAVQDYMLQEVQRVYRLQGVEINDKHIEVIVRQMLKKIKVEDSGDSSLLPGSLVDKLDYDKINLELREQALEEVEGKQVLLGITKASLATNSFLSAASFQETTKVLTEAAILGKTDPLIGLKENVILGKLIPAGTGMKRYRSVAIEKTGGEELQEELLFEEDMDEMEEGLFEEELPPEESYDQESYDQEDVEEEELEEILFEDEEDDELI